MSGPLPQHERRRRNAPAIPVTNLPAGGRKGPTPKAPYDLGPAGAAWWRWAWHLPQAAAWSTGDLYALARRAQLEDDLRALEEIGLDPPPLGQGDDVLYEWIRSVLRLTSALKASASGKLQLVKEARELDDRFGLTPKGIASLRWKIVAEEAEQSPATTTKSAGKVSRLDERRRRLSGAS